MNRHWFATRLLWISILVGVLPLLSACSRRAPWPDQCVWFAELTFGHDVETLSRYPAQKAMFDRLVVTCLTAPFEQRVFACTQESRAPMDCLRRVQPELFGDSEMVPPLVRDIN
jgi:hypothetical protein